MAPSWTIKISYNGGGGRCGPGSGPTMAAAEPVEHCWNGMGVLRLQCCDVRDMRGARLLQRGGSFRSARDLAAQTARHATGAGRRAPLRRRALRTRFSGAPGFTSRSQARASRRGSQRDFLLPSSCSRGASKFSRSTCNAEQPAFSELLLLLFVSLRPRPSQASTDVPRRSSIPPARLPYS